MAQLFSKVDLNKLWHDVQNEETLIYAKFGKDLFNISKVIGRKKVFFLTHSVVWIDQSRTPMYYKTRRRAHTHTGRGIIVYGSSLKSQTSYIVDFASEADFVSEPVGVLFLV